LADLLQIGRLGIFLLFIVLGVHAARRKSRRAVNVLIAYTIAVTTAVGFTQRESWPFTTWALFHHLSPRQFDGLAFEFVDDRGGLHEADARMWQPTSDADVQAWMAIGFERLPAGDRIRLLRSVLARAETARQRLVATGRAPNEWLLDGFAAPYHFLRPKPWTEPATVAGRRFIGVRVVRMKWDVERRAADPRAVSRQVVDQFNER
jgi:hypothetical protein